jgi:hypothetical protein
VPLPTSTNRPSPDQVNLQVKIQDTLRLIPEIAVFTVLLSDGPDLFQLLNPKVNHNIIAPSNDAVARSPHSNFRKRDYGDWYSPEQALSFIQGEALDGAHAAQPQALKTVLSHPTYANLGPGEPISVVALPAQVPGKPIQLVSGMGDAITVGNNATPFGGGNVLVADG